MEELITALLGVHSFTPEQIKAASEAATLEVQAYTRRQELDAELVAIALNRLGTEGAASLGFSGVTENYLDGYPAHIKYILNSKRKLKVL